MAAVSAPRMVGDLVVDTHKLSVQLEVTFLAGRDRLTEAMQRQIEAEFDQHLAAAFDKRGLNVLSIEGWSVTIDGNGLGTESK